MQKIGNKFLIKHNDLDGDGDDLKTPQREPNKLDVEHARLRSLSAVSKRVIKHEENENKKGKPKEGVLSKLFKNPKNDLAKIISKIDKFADKKVSHFMNLRKIKKREFNLFDLNDGVPQRFISRTFTGGFDSNYGK